MNRDETVALLLECKGKRVRGARGGAGRRQIRRRSAEHRARGRESPLERLGTKARLCRAQGDGGGGPLESSRKNGPGIRSTAKTAKRKPGWKKPR